MNASSLIIVTTPQIIAAVLALCAVSAALAYVAGRLIGYHAGRAFGWQEGYFKQMADDRSRRDKCGQFVSTNGGRHT